MYISYSYNRGGISNQKIALLGLFMKAMNDGPTNIILPNLIVFDQITMIHKKIPISSAFDMTQIKNFANSIGISIIDREPVGDEGGWEFFHYAEDQIARAAALGELRNDNVIVQFFLALIPLVRVSKEITEIKSKAFDELGIKHVAQMRIERDWEFHVQHRVKPEVGFTEENIHSPGMIIQKMRTTFPSNLSKIYVTCDEAALTTSIAQIKLHTSKEYGIELYFKSDFLSFANLGCLSLLDLSQLDFEMAVSAEYFIGTTRSTFSCLASLLRFAYSRNSRSDYIYNLPGTRLAQRLDNGAFASARLASAENVWDSSLGFELGRVLQESGETQLAIKQYAARADFGGPDHEEVFLSLYRVAQLKSDLGFACSDVLDAFWRASRVMETRAEPLHGGARYARSRQMYDEAYKFSSQGLEVKLPENGRFVEAWIYEWAIIDEYAVSASWTARYLEGLQACIRLLISQKLPENNRDRVVSNAKFLIERLADVAKPSNS